MRDVIVGGRLRGRGTRIGRAVGAVAAAGLLWVGMPTPATAAPTPTITISDVTVAEGNSGTTTATFTIQVAPKPRGCCPLQVNWSTAAGTAGAGDYTTSSGSVSFTKTVGSRTVSVPVIGDTLDEPNETFFVNLSGLVGSPGIIGDGQALGTITDDDAVPSLAVGDVNVVEGNAGTTTATFTISLSAASGQAVTVDWSTVPGTAAAGTDYVSGTGSRTLAAGSTSTMVGVTVNGDTADEINESFSIVLANPINATIGDGTGVGTITDDDPLPVLTIGDVSVAEGNAGTTTATFTVDLSAASGQSVSVNWITADGTATQPGDYASGAGTVTFAAGDTNETVDVAVKGDTLDEPDESFGLNLSSPLRATIGDGTGVGTITDDDPLAVLTISDATIVEGAAGTTTATLTVTLSPASAKTVTVGWATSDDTGTQPSDYVSGSGTITFVPGDTSETISVTVNGDVTAELDETLRVTLTSPVNAAIGDAVGTVTIDDDELLPVIDIDDPVVLEGASGTTSLSFAVTLSHPSASTVTVDWTTVGGTATGGVDFMGSGGMVSFSPLDVSEIVNVTVNGDATFERDETVPLELSNATNAPIGDLEGIGTISNDDAAPAISVADVGVTEGNPGTSILSFAVSLSEASAVDAAVDFATSDGTATAGVDYVGTTGTLIVPAGETGGTVQVTVNGDRTHESDETLTLSLSTPVDASVADGSGTGTILNDDRIPTTLTLRAVRKPASLIAKGLLEPTTTGHRVTVTLFRKSHGRFVRVAAKTVNVKAFRDRDHDGQQDGSYAATFARPSSGGLCKLVARFKGTATYRPTSRVKLVTLPPL